MQNSKTVVTRNVYLSTSHRDTTAFPSASTFSIFLPMTIKNVFGVRVRCYKYTPEPLINSNNNTIPYTSSAGSGNIVIDRGDYSQDLTTLMTALNQKFNAIGVQFTFDPVTQLAQFSFISSTSTNYVSIPPCRLLQQLGYPVGMGVYLYKSGHAPSNLAQNYNGYLNVATSTIAASAVNNTDLVLSITNLEAISSFDSVSNRATAVLMSNRTPNSVNINNDCDMYPLLQTQARIQQLRVNIYDSNGDLYDLGTDNASFMIEFYCYETAEC